MYYNSRISQKIAKACVIPIVASLMHAACSSGNEEKGEKIPAKPGTPMPEIVKTTPIRFINPVYELTVPAELAPNEEVSVFARIPGFVQHLYADRGARVHK